MMKTVDVYMALPYRAEVMRDDGGYFARIAELPGCMTWAARIEDLWPLIEDAKRVWIADALACGDPVPVPNDDDASGTSVVIRLPKRLHRDLMRQAQQVGMSLDTVVAERLAR